MELFQRLKGRNSHGTDTADHNVLYEGGKERWCLLYHRVNKNSVNKSLPTFMLK